MTHQKPDEVEEVKAEVARVEEVPSVEDVTVWV